MKRIFFLLLITALLFACTLTAAPPTPTSTAAPTAVPLTDTSRPTASLPPMEVEGYTLVYIHRYEGAFNDLLAEHARQAAALGQEPIAYFTARW